MLAPLERHLAPPAPDASVMAALAFSPRDDGATRVVIPRPEIHISVRFGSGIERGVDAHVIGANERVRRKPVRGVRRVLMARLRLGTASSVLGVPESAIDAQPTPLAALWGEPATERMLSALAEARDTTAATRVLDRALTERIAASRVRRQASEELALRATSLLAAMPVGAAARELGVSERHLRRVFRGAFGLGPKTYARLLRFHRALESAQASPRAGWASIACASGYYDQAHLIADFGAIAGTTPAGLLRELRAAPAIG